MTLYEIITTCLYLLDNDSVVSVLDNLLPYYNNYKYGSGYTLVEPNTVLSPQDYINLTGEECRKREYDSRTKLAETNNRALRQLKLITNKVLKLISTSCLPCTKKVTISVNDNCYDLSEIEDFMSIKSIKLTCSDKFNSYNIINNKVYIDSGEYELIYYYKIDDYDYFEIINDFPRTLTYLAVVDGVLGEYYILNGFYDEADYYLARFEKQMLNASRKNCEVRIKERLWLWL